MLSPTSLATRLKRSHAVAKIEDTQGKLTRLPAKREYCIPHDIMTQVRFPCGARKFSPKVNFQCRLSYGIRAFPCAIACINICAHVKEPVIHARVW